MALLEHRGPSADSPPLHIHVTEGEIFYILEGELRIRCREKTYLSRWVSAGSTLVNRNNPWRFERFVRAMSRPAERIELPPLAGTPTPEAIELLTETARAHSIEIIGPPLH